MSRWRQNVDPEVIRFVNGLPGDEGRLLRRAIRALPDGDVVRLSHHPGLFQLRVDDWRVIFEFAGPRCVHVILVDRRDVVYDRLDTMHG